MGLETSRGLRGWGAQKGLYGLGALRAVWRPHKPLGHNRFRRLCATKIRVRVSGWDLRELAREIVRILWVGYEGAVRLVVGDRFR